MFLGDSSFHSTPCVLLTSKVKHRCPAKKQLRAPMVTFCVDVMEAALNLSLVVVSLAPEATCARSTHAATRTAKELQRQLEERPPGKMQVPSRSTRPALAGCCGRSIPISTRWRTHAVTVSAGCPPPLAYAKKDALRRSLQPSSRSLGKMATPTCSLPRRCWCKVVSIST